mmetsp:Transcript_10466/g.22165  ORF Transcript_10466/g.22165 Transcript_10466/m.22165 type:complete len:177 (+) Transcript_10466:88-618(+)
MTKMKTPSARIITAIVLASIAILQNSNTFASAFLPPSTITTTAGRRSSIHHPPIAPPLSPSHCRDVTSSRYPHRIAITNSKSITRLQSFFGLGPAELLIIAVAGLVVIGPSKLLQFSKEAGSVAGQTATGFGDEWSELKAIPEEFQKGVEEGEIEARSRKAKVMDEVGGKEEEKKE